MEKPQITAFLKTYCGWSAGVRAVLNKYNLPYTEKDIIANPAFRWEMEVEQYLIEHSLVQPTDAVTEVPLNAPCATEQHESNVQVNF
jgi:hypothetical protein